MTTTRISIVICILSLAMACATKETREHRPDVVRTSGGYVRGYQNASNDVTIYKGVPYASSPIGQLRWRSPVDPLPWNDTLSCREFGPSPIQNDPVPFRMWTQEFITPREPLSEDCLYLNIWTPSRSKSRKLPVLVWIHGGAFISGSGACQIYDGEELAKEGIVYVSINYRLGIFGFLAHPDLTSESTYHASGNYGLLDQIHALRWVKNNIEAFGGDPEKITIAGQSAGAMSVQALVASPLTAGLFRHAIAQSGAMTGIDPWVLKAAEATGESLSAKLGASLAALRELTADSVLQLGNTFPFRTFFPVIDGYVLPENPKAIIVGRKHNKVRIMAGWVTGDADLVLRDTLSSKAFRDRIQNLYSGDANAFLNTFPASTEEEAIASQRKLAMLQFAGHPCHRWASNNDSSSFLYEFRYVPSDKPGFPNYGAFHTADVPFALRTLNRWDRPWTSRDRNVQEYMSAYWINFVKTGDPNGAGAKHWKPYGREGKTIMVMASTPVAVQDLYEHEFITLDFVRQF